ncbi:MAG: MBL fold metallo-hydrolase [Solobacterium sp.]|nr:MBL fold metallo-hydrolase [Solobacterium sp.]
MISDHYYSVEKVTAHIDAIRSRTGEIMYLIKGEDKALLIDTCLGVGNLRQLTDSLTDLPLTVWITHGHVDHALGAPAFIDKEVYMNPADKEIYLLHSPLPVRQDYIEHNLRAEPGSWAEAEYIPPTAPDFFKDLHDNDSMDLGGIHAEAYALPGHTPGTMVVLIPEEKILITGDAANNATFVFDEFTSPIETYRENLITVSRRLEGKYDRCFMMHHQMEASGDLLTNLIQVCDEILKGTDDHVPARIMNRDVCIAKAASPHFQRHDGKDGNIVYRKDHLKAE